MMMQRLRSISTVRLVSVSAVLTVIGLALMGWSMVQPTWFPVMLAMTVGQIIGTTAFAIFALVIIRDLRRARREAPP